MSIEKQFKEAGMIVATFGGGTDSAAQIIGLVRGGFRIDKVLFADTGAEEPRTYAFVSIFSSWLVSKGYPAVTQVHAIHKKPTKVENIKGERVTLEEACLQNAAIPGLAFGNHRCAMRFKVTPQDDHLDADPQAQAAWASGKKVLKLIGYEKGEEYRMTRALKGAEGYAFDDKYDLCFPLIEWAMDREACRQLILSEGLPDPGKSSCFFCPGRKKAEILDLAKSSPDLLLRAIHMEDEFRRAGRLTGTTKGLNRGFSWRDFLEAEGVAIPAYDDRPSTVTIKPKSAKALAKDAAKAKAKQEAKEAKLMAKAQKKMKVAA